MRVSLTFCLVSFLAVSLHFPSSNIWAQNPSWQGGARGTAARIIGQRWKVGIASADLFAGPSVAYSKKGRVYEGEQVTILEVTRSQEWAKVSTPAGIQAWIKVANLDRPQDQVAQDPGRYRRQTQYAYDAQGRRINNNGQAAGSGQGMNQPGAYQQGMNQPGAYQQGMNQPGAYQQGMNQQWNGQAPIGSFPNQERNTSSAFEISLPVGVSQLTRRFASNVNAPPLSGLKSQAVSPSFGLKISSLINDYVIIDARLVVSMGSEVPQPAIPSIPDVETVNLKATQMIGEGFVSGGLPINTGFTDRFWLGGIVGLQYYKLGYTEVKYPAPNEKLAPLQTHTYLSAALGLRLAMTWSTFTWELQGGGALPLTFEQAPNPEGQWTSLGVWGRTAFVLAFTDHFKTALSLGYLRIGTEYKGPAEQADYSLAQPIFYTKASGYDQSIEALVNFAYSL